MTESKWRSPNSRFFVPKGAKWSAERGFFIEQPTEPRPFFKALMNNPNLSIRVFDEPHAAYVLVAPATDSDIIGEWERTTREEYAELMCRRADIFGSAIDASFHEENYVLSPGLPIMLEVEFNETPILQDGERGLILKSSVRFDGKEPEILTGFEPAEIRSMLLLWDRFDWPEQHELSMIIDDEAQWLIDAGLMRRSPSPFTGSFLNKAQVSNLHLHRFSTLEKLDPGRWAVASGSRADDEEGEGRGLIVDLHNSIIMPQAEVPFDDILEFKERRRDELFALRAHLRKVQDIILSSPDFAAMLVDQTEELQRAIQAQIRVAKEAGFSHRIRNLRTIFARESLAEVGASGALEWTKTGDAYQGLFAAAGSLAIKAVTGLAKSPAGVGPLRYVFSIHNELSRP
ncbi:DUF6236 family protein [Novosphingobium soli]|uniref:DUF6236 family protein n=1 Tax=Novosphingobium soli TaxID=574956 RepID=A0ABV6D1A1_9SPHN